MVRPRLDSPYRHRDRRFRRSYDPRPRQTLRRGAAAFRWLPVRHAPRRQTIEIDVNQEDLAAMTNMARTTVGAMLHQLQTDGHLEVGYRNLRLLAPDRLRVMLTD